MEFSAEEAMALIEVRSLLESRGIEAHVMSDEEVIGFVNRVVQWLADLIPAHEPAFDTLLRLAKEQNDQNNTL